MFDTKILYYSYENTKTNGFGVGLLGNKKAWVKQINDWNKAEGKKTRVKADNWDELTPRTFRGCQLAEIEPIDKDYLVTWMDGEDENCIRFNENNEIVWQNNSSKNTPTPQWLDEVQASIKAYKNK